VSPLRVALAGYGLAGRVFHGPLVAATPDLVLATVVTGNPERQQQVLADHPGAEVVASTAELLARPDSFDLLVVAATNDVHAELALAAVGIGKAVVVDKPLAMTAAAAADVVAAAQAAGVVLTVFQNRRWDSDQLTLRRLVADGSLGSVLRYESRFERWRPQPRADSWREALPAAEGGGLLLDLGSHLVDQALHLFGPAASVYAEVDARRGVSDDDDFLAVEHVSGVRSHLWVGALAGSPGPRLRVLGSAGAYVVEALDPQEDVLRATRALPVGGLPVPAGEGGWLVRGDDRREVTAEAGRWDLFYPAVAAAVRGEGPVPVEPADAVRTLELIEAARASAARREVVHLHPRGER
jgi:scyllo-inositol 2-dehydrogenase (NADP+)